MTIATIVLERNEQYKNNKNEVGRKRRRTRMLIENAYVFLLMGAALAVMFVPPLAEQKKGRK